MKQKMERERRGVRDRERGGGTDLQADVQEEAPVIKAKETLLQRPARTSTALPNALSLDVGVH